MSEQTLNNIIDFAISEEKQWQERYAKAAQKAGSRLAALLGELSDMEKGHAARLEAFKRGKIEAIGKVQVQDLKIGDYLIDVELNDASSIQDVMIAAIKAEMKAHDLYTGLAATSGLEQEKQLFEGLASEELKHKNDLEKAYDEGIYKEN